MFNRLQPIANFNKKPLVCSVSSHLQTPKDRRQVEIAKILSLPAKASTFFMGSCFGEEMHSRLIEKQHTSFSNPFGVIFHPFPLWRNWQLIAQSKDRNTFDQAFQKRGHSNTKAYSTVCCTPTGFRKIQNQNCSIKCLKQAIVPTIKPVRPISFVSHWALPGFIATSQHNNSLVTATNYRNKTSSNPSASRPTSRCTLKKLPIQYTKSIQGHTSFSQ